MIISKIKQASHYCKAHEGKCDDCIYRKRVAGIVTSCRLTELALYLAERFPSEWDSTAAERILNG